MFSTRRGQQSRFGRTGVLGLRTAQDLRENHCRLCRNCRLYGRNAMRR